MPENKKRKYLPGDPRAQAQQEQAEEKTAEQPAAEQPTRHGGQGSRERRRERRQKARTQGRANPEPMQVMPMMQPETPEELLRKQVKLAGEDFRELLRTSPLFGNDPSQNKPAKQLTRAHQQYQTMMMMALVEPLREGISAESIIRTVTMARVMWLYSPDFKDQVKEIGSKAFDGLDEAVTDRLARMKIKGTPGAEFLDSHWERIRNMREGDRVPFTAQSAGLAEVGLMERAYDAMREPGANQEAIATGYQEAISKLYAMANYDGVNSEELSKATRVVVGQMIKDDPANAQMFSETAFGDFRIAPDKEAVMGNTGRVVSYWDGGFVHHSGAVVESGSFGPRPPMSLDEHQSHMADMIARDMMQGGDVDKLHASMLTYALGWSSVPRADVRDNSTLDPQMRQRFNDVYGFVRGMRSDGVKADDAQATYSNAFMDALKIVEDTQPNLATQWAQKYGQSWAAQIQTMVYDPASAEELWKKIDDYGRGEQDSEMGNRGAFNSPDHASTDPRPDHGTDRTKPGPGKTDVYDTDAPTPPADPGRPYMGRHQSPDWGARTRRAQQNQRYNQEDTGFTGVHHDDVQLNGADPAPEDDDRQPEL